MSYWNQHNSKINKSAATTTTKNQKSATLTQKASANTQNTKPKKIKLVSHVRY
jgi:hypothetical protein